MSIRCAIGQDSHRFEPDSSEKILMLGGVEFSNHRGLQGNSDADVVLHAITNAISGITGVNILGKISDAMCRNGIKDSRAYIDEALKHLGRFQIVHVSISIEAATPQITPMMAQMRARIAEILNISTSAVGVTATTGEGLTAFGRGEGIQAFVILTVNEN